MEQPPPCTPGSKTQSPVEHSALLESPTRLPSLAISPQTASSSSPRRNDLNYDARERYDLSRFISHATYNWRDVTLKPGDTVELKLIASFRYRSLLKIAYILEDIDNGETYLRGHRFVNSADLSHLIPVPRSRQEFILLVRPKLTDYAPISHQALELVHISQALGIKSLSLQPRPSRKAEKHPVAPEKSEEELLVCHSVFIMEVTTNEARHSHISFSSGTLRSLHQEELDVPEREPPERPRCSDRNGVYTFGDVCAAAGGASRAAQRAGLDVKYAVEIDATRAQTYQLSFPRVEVQVCNLKEVGFYWSSFYTVDILHFSVPCTYWSKAHTTNGKNDKRNKKFLFKTAKTMELIQPRQVTIEQVDGLVVLRKNAKAFRRFI